MLFPLLPRPSSLDLLPFTVPVPRPGPSLVPWPLHSSSRGRGPSQSLPPTAILGLGAPEHRALLRWLGFLFPSASCCLCERIYSVCLVFLDAKDARCLMGPQSHNCNKIYHPVPEAKQIQALLPLVSGAKVSQGCCEDFTLLSLWLESLCLLGGEQGVMHSGNSLTRPWILLINVLSDDSWALACTAVT